MRGLSHRGAAAILAVAVSAGASTARAANGVYTNNTGASNWGTTTSWSGDIVASGAGFKADFASGVDITANRTITLEAPYTIGNLIFDDSSHVFTLNGTGLNILTLDATGDADLISHITSGPEHRVTINAQLVGTGPVTFGTSLNAAGTPAAVTGIGTVILNNTSNSLTGSLEVAQGQLQLGTSFASLGGAPSPNLTILTDGVLSTNFDFTDTDWQARVTTASTGSLAFRASNTSVDLTNHQGLHVGAANGQTVSLGTLTLHADDASYNFGGGGGALNVTANLADGSGARSLIVRSPSITESTTEALVTAVTLTGSNGFTGDTTVSQHSVLLYGSSGAMGASATPRFITVNAAGMVGAASTNSFSSLQTQIVDRIATGSVGTFVLTANSSENFDFSAFPNLRFGAFGTATHTGSLTYANGAIARFRGLGSLTVDGPLPTNIAGIDVNIDVASSTASSFTLRLTGNNSGLNVPITVGSTASSTGALSTLLIGADNVVGAGDITVVNSSGRVRLLDGVTLANNVILGNGSASKVFGTSGASGSAVLNGTLTTNDTGDRENDVDVSTGMTLTINGAIGGTGDLEKTGSGLLVLTNPATAITQRFDVTTGDVRFTFNVPSTFANTASNAGIFLRGGNIELQDGLSVAEGVTFDDSGGNKTIRLQDNVAFTGTFNNVSMNDTTAGYEHDLHAHDGVLTIAGNVSGTSTSGIDIVGDNAHNGTVVFTGATGYTKRVRLESGVFRIAEEQDLGNAPGAFSADHLLLSGGTLETTATFAIDDANRGIGVDASSFIRVAEGTTLTVQTVVSGTVATNRIQKHGAGTLVLNRANTHNAEFEVHDGVVRLDFAAAGAPATNILYNGLTLATQNELRLGGARLEVVGTGAGTNSQSLFETLFETGQSSVHVNAATLNLGAIVARSAATSGSVVDFTTEAGGVTATTTGTADTLLTSLNVAYATVGGVDWAAKDAGNANIVAGSTIGGFYTASTGNSLVSNADVATDVALEAPATPGSIRFNEAASRTITATGQTLTTGGVLVTPNVLANSLAITGGTLRSASTTAGADLVVIQNNTLGDLTIGSTIADNTNAKGLTKAGSGRLILTASNTYTGPTFLVGGTLSISDNANLGAPATGAALAIDGATLEVTGNVALDNAGVNLRQVNLGDKGATFKVTSGNRLTVSGVITRNAEDASVNGLTKTDAGTLLLRGINIYSGATTVAEGILQVGDETSTAATTGNNSTRNILSVSASATLTGTGTIAGAGAATPHSIAGILSPGGTAALAGDGEATLAFNGTLSLTATSTATFSIVEPTGNAGAGVDVANLPVSHPALVDGVVAAGTHDHLQVSHLLTLAGDVVVDGSTLGSYASPASGDVFNLIDAGAINATAFNVGSDLTLPALSGGLTWDTQLFTSHGVLVVVPEPASAGLLAMLGIGLLARRRRR